ncbi:MAG: hypothetical protein GX070_12345 [Alcaligenaceae bacterium]|nr:hypothetical protein [Alcaligenaceae bacterium]
MPKDAVLKLSEADRARINARSARGLVNIVLAQFVLLLLVVLLGWVVSGVPAALSAVAGGMAYLIPSALFVVHMLLKLYSGKNASVLTFFWGEAFKLGGTLALLALIVKVSGSFLVWPALLGGLIAVLKGYVLLLMFNKLS